MKKIVWMIFLCGTLLGLHAETLTFATEATYPPFESVDSSGNIIGFDVDIMNALCVQMQDQCTIANAPFDSLIPSLQIGKYDAIIASLAITTQRQQVVDFTDPYFPASVSFVAPKGSDLKIDATGLKGKAIGVQGDTTFYHYLKAAYGDTITINTYKSEESAFTDLANGRVDAVMGDTVIIAAWLKQGKNGQQYAYVGQPISDVRYFGPGSGIAVSKSNNTLLTQLNKALSVIKKNGQYQQLMQKWFGVS